MEQKKFGRFLFPSMKTACQFLKDIEDVSASGVSNMVGARIDESYTGMLDNGGVIIQTLTANAYQHALRRATLID